MKAKIFVVFTAIIGLIAVVVIIAEKQANVPMSDFGGSKQKSSSFDKGRYSVSDPNSIWVITNKVRPLEPKTYTPADLVIPNVPLRKDITDDEKLLRAQAANALESLVSAAKEQGVVLNLQSGYRSYDFQKKLYSRYVREQGQDVADIQSARPGFSEHQTGLAADLGGKATPSCDVEQCFGGTIEGKWLAANAYKYGFTIRYQEGRDKTTGYIYEPWHIRYVGKELAAELEKGATTMEDFFGTGDAPTYR